MAPHGAPEGELDGHEAVVMGSEEGIHGAVQDVVAWCGLEAERARLRVRREHGEPEPCDH